MTLRTITFDDEQWQVVPKRMTDRMWGAGVCCGAAEQRWEAILAAAPEPPAQQPMTEEEAKALIPPVLRSVTAGNLTQVSTGYLIAMMRAVERHHGIGKGESNAD